MVQEAKTAQIQLARNVIIEEGSGGSIVWVTPTRARHLIDNGVAVAFQPRATIQPSETKAAGDAKKPVEPVHQMVQSFKEAQDIQSTDSAQFGMNGKAGQQSLSEADRASQKPKSRQPRKRTKKG